MVFSYGEFEILNNSYRNTGLKSVTKMNFYFILILKHMSKIFPYFCDQQLIYQMDLLFIKGFYASILLLHLNICKYA